MYFVFLCFYKNEINITNKKKYISRMKAWFLSTKKKILNYLRF